MTRTLRVLNIEDSERDSALLMRHLSKAGYEVKFQRVDTAEAIEAALLTDQWDVILSDYSMPKLSALEALEILKRTGLDVPFIIISGTVGEDLAVSAMLEGANDYVMKGHLARLSAAIERELQEAENRRARRHAEEVLKASEAELRALFEAMDDLVLVLDTDGRYLKIAPTSHEYLYRPPSELLGKTLHEVFAKDQADFFLEHIRRAAAEGRMHGVEYSLELAGKKTWFDGTVSPISIDSVVWISRDITERKLAEEFLREREQRFRSLIENSSDAIALFRPEGSIIYASPSTQLVLGFTPEEMIQQSPFELIHGEDLKYVQQCVKQALKQPRAGISVNARARHKDGSWRWLEGTFTNLLDEPSVAAIVNNYRDITDRKLAEEEMARLNSQLENQRRRVNDIVANVPGVVWEAWGQPDAATQRIDFVSEYIEKMLGYSVDEWLNTPNFWLSIVHPEDKEQAAQAAAAVFASDRSSAIEFRWVAKDGRVLWVESNSALITDKDDKPIGLRGVTTDISERKTLEEQLRQSQKMEAIGQLAGGVAHDFNNLLTVISGFAELAVDQLKSDDPARYCLGEISKASNRAASLTRQLLAFSRRQVLQPKVLDLNSVVAEMEEMLQRIIGEDISLHAALDPDLGKTKADPGQIEQVVMNLVVNARDALPDGGNVTIETTNAYVDDNRASQEVTLDSGEYIIVSVSDTGTGMDEETRKRIFEPFFTTKEIGKGTGLGLSTVYGIVQQSGGAIEVFSKVGRGTTFKIYLPRCADDTERNEAARETEQQLTGSETILLTEDEEMIRNLVREALEMNGYKVLEAKNGRAALAVCEQYDGPIHLLVTDVIMPEMNGYELATRISKLRPELKLLYMSGYTDDSIARQRILDPDVFFLQKPFTPRTMVRKVREALDYNRQTA